MFRSLLRAAASLPTILTAPRRLSHWLLIAASCTVPATWARAFERGISNRKTT
jgi:hypothetical protein